MYWQLTDLLQNLRGWSYPPPPWIHSQTPPCITCHQITYHLYRPVETIQSRYHPAQKISVSTGTIFKRIFDSDDSVEDITKTHCYCCYSRVRAKSLLFQKPGADQKRQCSSAMICLRKLIVGAGAGPINTCFCSMLMDYVPTTYSLLGWVICRDSGFS